ncbi:MAG: S4 domain-containing protein, partial [Rhodocyclaceae bacterium]|nr:S4 domain-containing protein [Rhodocyclaceae bacterium]
MMEEPKIRCDDYISPAEIAVPPDCVGLRLDMALARLLPEPSRSRLQAWLTDGLILLDGANADAKRKVWG